MVSSLLAAVFTSMAGGGIDTILTGVMLQDVVQIKILKTSLTNLSTAVNSKLSELDATDNKLMEKQLYIAAVSDCVEHHVSLMR